MPSYNKCILIGNLTRDPQLKYLQSQTPVCEFGIAVNNKYKTKSGDEREETLFMDCTVFGRRAEVVQQYCQKGKSLLVEGKLRTDSWEDKQSGQKRSKTILVVDDFQFVGGQASDVGRTGPSDPIGNERQFKEKDIPF